MLIVFAVHRNIEDDDLSQCLGTVCRYTVFGEQQLEVEDSNAVSPVELIYKKVEKLLTFSFVPNQTNTR